MARFALAPLAAALFVGLSSGASANHIGGATYNGTSAGGAVSFTVTPDGGGIGNFNIEGPVANNCGSVSNFSKTYAEPLPITNHTFSDTSSTFILNGSFPGTQSASGTYRIKTTIFGPGGGTCDTGDVTWNATTTATPPEPQPDPEPEPGPGPEPGPEPGPGPEPIDTVDPVLELAGKLVQKLRKAVTVGVGCPSEACIATATGYLDVPRTGAAARFKLRRATANIAAGDRETLKLRVRRKARKAARRALRRGKTVKAKVRVAVEDAAGNRSVRKRTIRLKL